VNKKSRTFFNFYEDFFSRILRQKMQNPISSAAQFSGERNFMPSRRKAGVTQNFNLPPCFLPNFFLF
jgi:hypothetical protein